MKKLIHLFMLCCLVTPALTGTIDAYAQSIEENGTEIPNNGQNLVENQVQSMDLAASNAVEQEETPDSSQEVPINPVVNSHLALFWRLEDGTTATFLSEEFTQEYWKGSLQVKGQVSNQEQTDVRYVIDLGNTFIGTLSSKNPQTQLSKLPEAGQWQVTTSLANNENGEYQEDIDVVLQKHELENAKDQNDRLIFDSITLKYDGNIEESEKLTLALTFPVDHSNVAELPEMDSEKQDIPATSQEELSVKPRNIVANLSVSEAYSTPTPLAGEYFDMTVRVNSGSIGESEEAIKNLAIDVTLPDSVELITLPESNNYMIKKEQLGANTKLTIQYLKELPVGKMLAISFGLRFKRGISLPKTVLNGSIKATASNANEKEKILDEIHPKVNGVINHLVAEKNPDAESIEVHTSTIKVIPEAEVGGVNIKNGKLHIEFPADITLYSVNYQGTNYPVNGPTNGVYSVDILVGDIDVANAVKHVELTYEYPYSTTGKPKDYEIKATLTGERLDGIPVKDEALLKETVPALGDLNGYPGTKFFTKTAPKKVLKAKDQALAYTLTFTPRLDMREVYLVDDPVRNANEPDFFKGFRYESFSWSAHKSQNPAVQGLISTEVFYQTKNNTRWQSMGATNLANTVHVSSLGLAKDDYVTTVKYVFTYQGSKKLPKDAGKVSISAIGKTLEGVKDNTLSLKDGLTNTLYIYGDRKYANAPDSSYEAFVKGGYEANADDRNNTQNATTIFTGEGAYAGYSKWEHPFSPSTNDIGSTFVYSISVNNVYGSGALRDAILYITVPTSITIENVALIHPQNDPNAQIEIKQIDQATQLVIIRYNNDWSNNERWNDNHAVRITANGSEHVRGVEEFNNYLVSGDPKQNYDGGADWVSVPGVGNMQATMSKYRIVKFNRSVGLDSKKEISKDGTHFSRVTNLLNQETGNDVTFRLTVPNNGDIKLNELHIIDQLPNPNDTMTISEGNRHSTSGGQLKAITLADGSALPNNYEVLYSTNTTAENNLVELKNLTSDQSTWQHWDGQTPLDQAVTAIKIIKKDGLASKASVSFNLSYFIPKINSELATLWNSFAVGGSYTDGITQATLEVGEPVKSGAYIGQGEPTKKIAGVIWADENANGLREDSEAKIADAEVSLYDWNNDLVDTTKTKVDGSYEFNHLYNRKYRVTVKRTSSSFNLTTYQTGTNKMVNNDFLELETDKQYGEAFVDLTTEDYPLNIDGGYTEPTTIDGFIWYDSNRDGLQTKGEEPVKDLSVSLYRMDNTRQQQLIKTVKTAANGKYYFTGAEIKPGTYQIHAEIPNEYAATVKGKLSEKQNSKFNLDGKTDTFEVKKGSNSDWDLGLILDLPTYTSLNGKKIWKGDQKKKSHRPKAIEVQLLQDGKAYGKPIAVKSNLTDEWTFSFEGLPEYQPKSIQKYNYTIKEVNVPAKYHSQVDNKQFTITNTYIDDEKTDESSSSESEASTSESDSTDSSSENLAGTSQINKKEYLIHGKENMKRTNQKILPKTGEKIRGNLFMGLAIIIGLAGTVCIRRARSRKV